MGALLVAVTVIAVFVVIDRVGLWAERRGWVYWRKRRNGRGGDAGGSVLGVMDELFSPGRRHTIEEIASKKNGRIDIAVGDDEWVDLDSGRVRLSTTRPPSAVREERRDDSEAGEPHA
ncbi:Uncharacterised protein [Rhodococcus rhodochrous]|uniref:DUF6191 domain-containing protein n=1 Tax=Rhodococcus TaxID=1827 RepID=UPI000B9497DF|nr:MULTISPECIES: DUF6191 domain-containing protein [Rhodococcus]SNV19249.1 Uncharacterised protein [Rhodococcus rhodochrous]